MSTKKREKKSGRMKEAVKLDEAKSRKTETKRKVREQHFNAYRCVLMKRNS